MDRARKSTLREGSKSCAATSLDAARSWQIKFDAPAEDGKRQQRYATVRGTYKDAQKELTKLLKLPTKARCPIHQAPPFAEYLAAG